MGIFVKIIEFFLGAFLIIFWVTLLGLMLSQIAPKKIRKKSITYVDCISIAGIGLFCSLLTLFLLWILPQFGLPKFELSQLFGNVLPLPSENSNLIKWLGQGMVITLGVLGSYFYAFYIFKRIRIATKYQGLVWGLILFLFGSLFLFPGLSLAFPQLFSPNQLPIVFESSAQRILLTFLISMLFFGSLMAGIYKGWEEI